jgi:hypothetical protein
LIKGTERWRAPGERKDFTAGSGSEPLS